MVGKRCGRLVVTAFQEIRRGQAHWLCRCDCGNSCVSSGTDLRSGAARSCRCYNNESIKTRSVTHGLSKTPAYISWTEMKQRCLNPQHPAYSDYGGRGI